ncbi:putative methyltransferase-domain-containing protein [Chytriomyces sp. MP71]|nr:putative methyltransferase-domain-containing protein [Chytriomyces sp. MP71]
MNSDNKSNETFDSLQTRLDAWVLEETSRRGGKPSKREIETTDLYQRQTALLLRAAAPPVADQCIHFQRRQKRFCCKKRTFGSEWCGLHRASSLAATTVLQQRDGGHDHGNDDDPEKRAAPKGRKQNIAKRMKRMLNPFKVTETPQEALPQWDAILTDTCQPLMLDIGCAKGRYLLHMARSDPTWNYCGVELFAPLVDAANIAASSLPNLHYIHANIALDLERLAFRNLRRVSFLFPDPWSCGPNAKKKNEKKRVMSPDFAMRLSHLLPPGGEIYFASDWLDLAIDIRDCLLGTGRFSIPRIEYFPQLCGWSQTDASVNSNARMGFQWRCVCPADVTVCAQRPTNTSHVALLPYIPTVPAERLNADQAGLQARAAASGSVPIIDVQTAYAKPDAVASREGSDDAGSREKAADSLWLEGIPFGGGQTERDLVCEAQWRAVYRMVVVRNENSSQESNE